MAAGLVMQRVLNVQRNSLSLQPQSIGRDRRALGKGLKLGPRNRGRNARNGAGQHSDEWRARGRDWLDWAGRLLPVSKTVWLEESVHDVPVQRPELVAGIIEEHVRDGFFDA